MPIKKDDILLDLLKNLDGKIDNLSHKMDENSSITKRIFDDIYGDSNTNKLGLVDKVKNIETTKAQAQAIYWVVGIFAGIAGFFLKYLKG